MALAPSRVCVFCGSSPGSRPDYAEAARELGRSLASRGLGLVYGGADVGLMGAMADAALEAGGEVIGVIPASLVEREVAHRGLSDLRIVGSMHERKALMAELAGAFVALPGGLGTLEELLEILTWAQLGLHAKPCAVLDVAGFFEPLRAMLARCTAERFLRPEDTGLLRVKRDVPSLLDALETARPREPRPEKWIDRDSS